MLTGRRAFQKATDIATLTAVLHDPPPKLPARIPARIAQIVGCCLEQDPNRRYWTGAELAMELRRLPALGPRDRKPYA